MDLSARLTKIVGEGNVLDSPVDCLGYSRDMSVHMGAPDLVVFAESTEQVSEVMKVCHQAEVPVIPRGGGTSVTGAVLAPKGGVLLNLIRMNQVLEVNLPDHYVRVQPGLVCARLNGMLAPNKFFFPPDPGSAAIATIGGMINTNASGIRAVKYGTTQDYVMGLTVVLADGRVMKTGTIAPKSSSGYNLTQLFCRSEGTLGVITEAVLKILPTPPYAIAARLDFPDIPSAGAAVTEMLASGIPIATCEVLDNVSMDVLRKAAGLDLPRDVGCMIMMELDGHRAAVQEYVGQVNKVADKHGVMATNWTDDEAEKAPLWEARHRLVPAMSRLKPGYRLVPLMEDFGVPVSRIPETIAKIQVIGEKYGLPHRHLRPHRRRQPARHLHHGREEGRGVGRGQEDRLRAGGRDRRDGRHHERRARRGHGQGTLPGPRGGQAGHRGDGVHQERPGPQEHPEPLQDGLQGLGQGTSTTSPASPPCARRPRGSRPSGPRWTTRSWPASSAASAAWAAPPTPRPIWRP